MDRSRKERSCCTAVLSIVLLCVPDANAQSALTLYGILDDGITYVNNVGGHSIVQQSSGVFSASRFGFKGTEELGGGMRAIVLLENGFTLNNGALGQGSTGVTRLFGRQAYVGLASPYGSVTAGRQYDYMFDLGYYSSAAYVTSLSLRPGTGTLLNGNNGSTPDFDRIAGARVDSSVKYSSPNYGGVVLGALYGFGGQPGTLANGSTKSFGVRYTSDAFGAGAAFTDFTEPDGASHLRNWGMGAFYRVSAMFFTATYTNTRYSQTGDSVDVADVGGQYSFTPSFHVGVAYVFMRPNNGATNLILKGTRNQYVASTGYSFSKRTDVYAAIGYQRSHSGLGAQTYNFAPTSLSANGQLIAHVAIRQLF
ncbi:MAG: porin [Janthinobacterium lividum]